MTDVLKQVEKLNIDLGVMLRVMAKSARIQTSEMLFDLINSEVKDLLHYESMICGFGVISDGGKYVTTILHQNYPAGYLQEIGAHNARAKSPLAERWMSTLQPVLFQSGRDNGEYPAEWVRIFNKYKLRNTIGHGFLDARGLLGSYFIFSTMPTEVGEKEAFILEMITPHLHTALIRTLATSREFGEKVGQAAGLLNTRQKEILRWIKAGKTNWEIAQILGITQKSVKYHMEKIFAKLEVRNRAQAVSKAIFLGILN